MSLIQRDPEFKKAMFKNESKPVSYTGVPKKVHKFEIKNLCFEIRSISEVGVIC